MTESLEKFKSTTKYFLFSIIEFIITTIVTGFVFSKLWLWFIVPLFNMIPIGIFHSFGIYILIRFACIKIDYKKITKNSNTKPIDIEKMLSRVIISFGILLVGYIITLFM